uniref:RING-type E3 ubiquitin transferase n=1 Tax=Kryptolebias marmoratus TaxID=37003 RepID=A0A3Q3AJG0_KRYMA
MSIHPSIHFLPIISGSITEANSSRRDSPYPLLFVLLRGVPEEAVCRICHDSGVQEELLCPCECAGARAPVHRSCLEQRLAASRTGSCELCHCRFAVRKKPRPLLEWLQISGLQQETRTLFGDLVCFLLITPLATISGWLCLRRAVDHLYFSSQLEAVGLIALTVTLFTIYLFWALVGIDINCLITPAVPSLLVPVLDMPAPCKLSQLQTHHWPAHGPDCFWVFFVRMCLLAMNQ